MKVYYLLFFFFLCIALKGTSQKAPPYHEISPDRIQNIVDTLTCEYFGGRGAIASEKLYDYIGKEFQKYGLFSFHSSGFWQKMEKFNYLGFSDSSYIEWNNNRLSLKKDFIHSLWDFNGQFNHTNGEISPELFFAGYPDKKTDSLLTEKDIEGKIVVIFENRKERVTRTCRKQKALGIMRIATSKDRYEQLKGFPNRSYRFLKLQDRLYDKTNGETFLDINLSPEAGAKLLGINENKLDNYKENFGSLDDSLKYDLPQIITLNVKRKKKSLQTGNFVGYLPGTDISKEHIILSAHYDHLGRNRIGIFPGANDNASGVSSLMEIARVFAKAYHSGIKPKRTIVFIAFGLEEKGLLGSEYYVENPLLPLNKLKANINFDMVGRKDRNHDSISNYIYALGPDSLSFNLIRMMDSVNNEHEFVQLEFLNDHPSFKRFFLSASDQAVFLKKDIPALMINNGIHKDLHKPTDTPEKLNYQTIENVGELIFMTVWELANKP